MRRKEAPVKSSLENSGKYEIIAKVPLTTSEDLAFYYTPGVANVSQAIKADREKVFEYTAKANTIAIVSDGTRILGLGDIGPEAGLPVMEGKAILFKKFGGVDAVPLCINTKDEDEIVNFIKWIEPTFGAINIEDIKSPKNFNIAEKLSKTISIPVFQDDNHGTAVVVLAALYNALKLAGKSKSAKIIVNGAGTAGIGIANLLIAAGFSNIIVADSMGAIYENRDYNMNRYKAEIAAKTNRGMEKGTLEEIIEGTDVLIGVSRHGAFSKDMVKRMNEKPMVFALANPEPEIGYKEAKEAGAYIVATGRSDMPNQVNNLIAFPGIMRGLLDVRAKSISTEALVAAAGAIAKCVGRKALGTEYIIPSFADNTVAVEVASNVAEAVASVTTRLGLARVKVCDGEVRQHAKELIKRYSRIERLIIGR
ncbi:MAG: NADP-dependent malic enzyme [Candidatus Micrarchaeaceae archaeon]